MSTDVFMSVAVLLVTAIAGFLAARFVFNRLRTARAVWLSIAIVWIVVVISILVVDVNIPLAESHYRPGGAPAPVSLAILAIFLRFAAGASIAFGQSKLRSTFSS